MEDYSRYVQFVSNSLGFDNLSCAVVADGVGSLPRSGDAARLIVELMLQQVVSLLCCEDFIQNDTEARRLYMRDILIKMVLEADAELVQRFTDCESGATLVCAVLLGKHAVVCGCGDSPAYLLRNSFGSWHVELLLPLDNPPDDKNKLLQRMGNPRKELNPHVKSIDILPNDLLVMGSDGAFGDVEPGDLINIAKKSNNIEAFGCLLLKISAMTTGDNQSLIVLKP
jgi:serine/threonine protein phosphatase PrpC